MARLSYRERQKLRRSQFAIPERREYPIEDEAHARNALARVSQQGSPREKSRVRSAVHRRYPGISCSLCGSHHHMTREHEGMSHRHRGGDPPPSIEIGAHLRAVPEGVGGHIAGWHMGVKGMEKGLDRHLGKSKDEFSLSVPDSKELEL